MKGNIVKHIIGAMAIFFIGLVLAGFEPTESGYNFTPLAVGFIMFGAISAIILIARYITE